MLGTGSRLRWSGRRRDERLGFGASLLAFEESRMSGLLRCIDTPICERYIRQVCWGLCFLRYWEYGSWLDEYSFSQYLETLSLLI